jgi:hypothetical protein
MLFIETTVISRKKPAPSVPSWFQIPKIKRLQYHPSYVVVAEITSTTRIQSSTKSKSHASVIRSGKGVGGELDEILKMG